MRRALWLAIPMVVWGQAPEVTTEVGYRVLPSTRGDWKSYRSVDNLAEGPRLLQFAGAWTPGREPGLDALRVTGSGWGDPMNALHLTMDKAGLYQVHVRLSQHGLFQCPALVRQSVEYL
jgi:hypothetical protein